VGNRSVTITTPGHTQNRFLHSVHDHAGHTVVLPAARMSFPNDVPHLMKPQLKRRLASWGGGQRHQSFETINSPVQWGQTTKLRMLKIRHPGARTPWTVGRKQCPRYSKIEDDAPRVAFEVLAAASGGRHQ